ncbi:MAG: BrnT family toxin [Nitrospiraceae bacterium]
MRRTDRERMLFVVFAVRKNRIRVISARDMSKKERRCYAKEIEKNSEVQE